MPSDDNKAVVCRGANKKNPSHTMVMLHRNKKKGTLKIADSNVGLFEGGIIGLTNLVSDFQVQP
jgi:hypothetical protein